MADEVIDSGEGQEETAVASEQSVEASDAAAEQAVGDKMAEIFGDNDHRNQVDELEESGVVTPDNPEGLDESEVVATGEGEQTSEENPTLEDLKAAKAEAVANDDFERASELRDQIKELEATSAATPKEKTGVLSENERSVLRDLGEWTDEDITTLEESNPAFAKLTAKKLATGYNNLSLQYAQAARNGAPALIPPQAPAQNAATQQQTATLESLYKDLDKFSEIAGNEMVERFIRPLKSEVLDPLKDVISFVNEQRQNAIIREVNDAVDRVAKGGFEKLYGQPESLTTVQTDARRNLYSLADMIHVGASVHKVPMKYGEAIRRAHLILTADSAKAQARKELVKSVKNRSKQITARPSQRIPRVAKRGEAAAEAMVSKFWSERGE